MSAPTPKIGYIVSQFPCYDETFIMREMEAVARSGVKVYVFSLKRSRDPIKHAEAEALQPRTVYPPSPASIAFWSAHILFFLVHPLRYIWCFLYFFINTWHRFTLCWKTMATVALAIPLAREVNRRAVDHLHAHWATYPTTCAVVISRMLGCPFSFTGHAHDIYLDTTLLAEKAKEADFILTCTAHNKEYLLSKCKGTPPEKIIVSYHGLNLEKYQPQPRENSTPEIVSVGSLLPCKGYEYLIESAKLLTAEGKKFHVTIVGGGPEEARLRELVSSAGLSERITLTGYVKQEDMPRYYQQADIFVLPAVLQIHWGIPNVAVEAFACGLPVVITPLPSMSELIQNEDTGLIVPEKNPPALADALRKLLDAPELRKKMGMLGRKKVEGQYNIEKNALEIASFFIGSLKRQGDRKKRAELRSSLDAIIALLQDGRYLKLENKGLLTGLTAQELENFISAAAERLSYPPEQAFDSIELEKIEGEEVEAYRINFPLWFSGKESRRRLKIRAVRKSARDWRIYIEDAFCGMTTPNQGGATDSNH